MRREFDSRRSHMNILNLDAEHSASTQFSEYGELIEPGEAFFLAEIHGRDAVLSLNEAEKLLGLREFSSEERQKLAKSGNALPDGSFPIANCSDAANAIHAIGRAGAGKRARVEAHIRKRVKALGCSGSTFDNWK